MRAHVIGLLGAGIIIAIVFFWMSRQDEQVIRSNDQVAAPAVTATPPPVAVNPALALATPARTELIPATPVATPEATPRMTTVRREPSTTKPAMIAPPSPVVSAPPSSAAGDKVPAIPREEIAKDVDKVTLSLRDYRTLMGENPVGTNAEIAKALDGGNPKQARLLQEGLILNDKGELIDRWGTPYFFHQLSRDHMQIRSAGPDRKMYTDDDIVEN